MGHHACIYPERLKLASGYVLNLGWMQRLYSKEGMVWPVKTTSVPQNTQYIFLQYSVGRWHDRFLMLLSHCSVELKALSSTGEFPLWRRKANVK